MKRSVLVKLLSSYIEDSNWVYKDPVEGFYDVIDIESIEYLLEQLEDLGIVKIED